MEEWWKVWIGPAAPIVGALVGALIAALVTYYLVVKRKRLVFYIEPTENLTKGLRELRQPVTVNFADKEVEALNRSVVFVWNSGNSTIKDIEFDVVVPGIHVLCMASVDALRKVQDTITLSEKELEFDKTFSVRVPFLNSREGFDVVLYYDGQPESLDVLCRIEEVEIKITRLGSRSFAVQSGRFAGAAVSAAIKSI